MILLGLVTAGALTGLLVLIPLGFRGGDKAGEARLLDVMSLAPGKLTVTMGNPGPVPVIVELSLRRLGLRLRLESGAYVRSRRGERAAGLLAGDQALVGVLEAQAIGTFTLPVPAALGRRAELVAVVGQKQRLRAIHRLVELLPGHAPAPQRPEGDRVAELLGGRDRVLPGAPRVA